jgi:hypothetical protein
MCQEMNALLLHNLKLLGEPQHKICVLLISCRTAHTTQLCTFLPDFHTQGSTATPASLRWLLTAPCSQPASPCKAWSALTTWAARSSVLAPTS